MHNGHSAEDLATQQELEEVGAAYAQWANGLFTLAHDPRQRHQPIQASITLDFGERGKAVFAGVSVLPKTRIVDILRQPHLLVKDDSSAPLQLIQQGVSHQSTATEVPRRVDVENITHKNNLYIVSLLSDQSYVVQKQDGSLLGKSPLRNTLVKKFKDLRGFETSD